jgi:hypothetical protein
VDLKRRIAVLERRDSDRLDHPLCDESRRLRAEERTFEQIRQATRQVIALMWTMAADAGRTTAVSRGSRNLDDELTTALSALGQDDVRLLRAVCEALTSATSARRFSPPDPAPVSGNDPRP